jgi:signal transduction histidine kinase
VGDLAGGLAPRDADGQRGGDRQHDVVRIAEGVRVAVDADVAVISGVVDERWLEILAVAGSASEPDPTGTRWSRDDLDRYLADADRRGRISIASRRSVSHADLPAEHPFAASGSTVMLVPLHSDDGDGGRDGELVGVLATIGYLDLDGLDDDAHELIGLYADQARLAVDLRDERRALVEHLRLTHASQSLVYESLEQSDLRSMLASVTEPLAGLMRAGGVWVCAELDPGAHDEGVSHPADLAPRLGAELGALVQPLIGRSWSDQLSVGEDEDPALGRVAALVGDERALLAAIGTDHDARGALLVLRGADAPPWSAPERDTLAGLGRRLGWVVQQLETRQRDRHLVAELREVDQYRRDLVASLTHDLKTPLTAIALNAELLESDRPAPNVQPVAAIRRSAERLASLVDDLLALARAEEGLGPSGEDAVDGRSPADAVTLVQEACRHAEVEAQLRGVRYVVDLPDTQPVAVDGSALARVYVNVVDNAVKFSHPDGEVRISLRTVDGQVELTCADDGVGIAETDQAAVFDMFRRGRDARGVPGSGVGLAISQRILARLGGTIELSSELGRGSTFVVRVPAR